MLAIISVYQRTVVINLVGGGVPAQLGTSNSKPHRSDSLSEETSFLHHINNVKACRPWRLTSEAEVEPLVVSLRIKVILQY